MSRKRSMLFVFPKDSSTKDAIESHLRSSGFEIKLTREVNLSPEQKAELHKRNAPLGKAFDGQPVYVMVMEHPDAIAQWASVSRQDLKSDIYKGCYASPSEAVAKEDIIWLKGYLRKKTTSGSPVSATPGGNTTPSTKNSKDNSKQQQRKPTTTLLQGTTAGASRATSGSNGSSPSISPALSRRTASDPMAATAPRRRSTRSESVASAGRRGSPAPSRVPVKASSENVRATSATTNRKTPSTRVPSRAKKQQQEHVQEDRRPEEEILPTESEVENDTVAESTPAGIENSVSKAAEIGTSSVAPTDGVGKSEDEEGEETQSVQGELYPTYKGEEESEHDAEVAAATQHHRKPSAIEDITTPSTLRASLSPNSITSLPRPETPEVDQLRQRFESIAQNTSSLNNNSKQVPRRSSDSSPKNPFKGKDLKSQPPSGSRVKSMVEFFMDENLHKWEF